MTLAYIFLGWEDIRDEFIRMLFASVPYVALALAMLVIGLHVGKQA